MKVFLVLAACALLGVAATIQSGSTDIRFADITSASGIHFVHNAGKSGKKYLPETTGAGAAFIDVDGDGWSDIFFVNGRDWAPGSKKTTAALYRNNKNGTFTDITAGSGLDVSLYGLGVAVGDFDNDGRDDIYLTAIEGDRLYHNEGGGKFKDVTKLSGIDNANFGTSAAWFDYDRDGKLDLFVANYVQWTEKTDVSCSMDGTNKSYCTPQKYKGTKSRLFHNVGGGKFVDVTAKAGVGDPTSKSLGVAVVDYDGDGWPDLFVANDTQPNKLYHNNQNGTFTDTAMLAGVAFGDDGTARGAMGVDFADYDRSGRPHLLVGNFSNQMLGLYHNEGSGLFVDQAPMSVVGKDSLLDLAFGVFFFDYDLDGYPDILAANGHIEEEIGRAQPKIKYQEPPLLFHNVGGKKFENVSAKVGDAFTVPMVARGAIYSDIDHDGDLDVLFTTSGGPARILRNDGGNRNHWISIRTTGTKSNRDGIGAVVHIESAGGKQWSTVHSGSTYASQSDLVLTFGLGPDTTVKTIQVDWPSGAKQSFSGIGANQIVTIDESKGILTKSRQISRFTRYSI